MSEVEIKFKEADFNGITNVDNIEEKFIHYYENFSYYFRKMFWMCNIC